MTALEPRQLAGFARAVARKSRGQVALPPVPIGRAAAIALWDDIAASFGGTTGHPLSADDLDHLRRRAWQVSHGLARLSDTNLSLEGGLAFWRLALRLGKLAKQRKECAVLRAASVAAFGLAATQLAACTTLFAGNIKGNFACNAPNGTCAPSTVIDDQALSVIQNARPMTPLHSSAAPAMRSPAPARSSQAAYVPSGTGRITPARGDMVQRERRVLKVVFPSFVDGDGNLHEPRVVHAVVDDGAWMQVSSSEPDVIERFAGRTASTAASDVAAPPSALSATEPGQAHARSIYADPVVPVLAGPPTREAVTAARAKIAAVQSDNAIEAIRAEVQGRLAQAAQAKQAPSAMPQAPAPGPNAAQGGALCAPLTAAHETALPPAQQPASTPLAPANAPTAFAGKIEE